MMETKKINLKEIVFKHSEEWSDKELDHIKRIMIDFGKQLLDAAAKNARHDIFPGCQYGYLSSDEIFVEEESITETIKQVVWKSK